MSNAAQVLPLAGVTVVALEQVIAAPFATRQLAELGARVIKIERPGIGDASRAYDTTAYGMMGGSTNGHSFILVDRGGKIRWRADYGGPPNFTMFVADDTLLAEIRRALGISG